MNNFLCIHRLTKFSCITLSGQSRRKGKYTTSDKTLSGLSPLQLKDEDSCSISGVSSKSEKLLQNKNLMAAMKEMIEGSLNKMLPVIRQTASTVAGDEGGLDNDEQNLEVESLRSRQTQRTMSHTPNRPSVLDSFMDKDGSAAARYCPTPLKLMFVSTQDGEDISPSNFKVEM